VVSSVTQLSVADSVSPSKRSPNRGSSVSVARSRGSSHVVRLESGGDGET
jgi:hypothetical protein